MKKPETLQQALSDEIFIAKVKSELQDVINSRINRQAPKKGFSYRRDWYDRLYSQGSDQRGLTSDFLLENIMDIWNKSSKLSAEIRYVVESICNRALSKTLSHYDQIEAQNENEKH